jgi:hypothetical protein
VREATDVEGDGRVFEGAVMTALASEEVFDDESPGLGFARGVFVEDKVLGIILMCGPPTDSLWIFSAGEDFDAETGIHHGVFSPCGK